MLSFWIVTGKVRLIQSNITLSGWATMKFSILQLFCFPGFSLHNIFSRKCKYLSIKHVIVYGRNRFTLVCVFFHLFEQIFVTLRIWYSHKFRLFNVYYKSISCPHPVILITVFRQILLLTITWLVVYNKNVKAFWCH